MAGVQPAAAASHTALIANLQEKWFWLQYDAKDKSNKFEICKLYVYASPIVEWEFEHRIQSWIEKGWDKLSNANFSSSFFNQAKVNLSESARWKDRQGI